MENLADCYKPSALQVAQDGMRLVRWYNKHHRDLPWRKTQDPYLIWVSEVMLQQTQVKTVLDYYSPFIEAFPTVHHLAQAEEKKVLRYWAGLGYYRRARLLHQGAQFVVTQLQGKLPTSRQLLLQVPGIGPYTAGAILSLAMKQPEAIVDGNVQRVFARYYGKKGVVPSKDMDRFFWKTAEMWVNSHPRPERLNQALMEWGALICTPKAAKCPLCPLKKDCVALAQQEVELLPVKKKRTATKKLHWLVLVIETSKATYLQLQPPGKWWEGLWSLPYWQVGDPQDIPRQLQHILKENRTWTQAQPLRPMKHTVTHHQINLYPFRLRLLKQHTPKDWAGSWIEKKKLSQRGISAMSQKLLDAPLAP